MEQFDTFTAVVALRSGGDFVPKITSLKMQGEVVRATVLWPIEDSETSIYRGEFACEIEGMNGERFPCAWIASGDLHVVP